MFTNNFKNANKLVPLDLKPPIIRARDNNL